MYLCGNVIRNYKPNILIPFLESKYFSEYFDQRGVNNKHQVFNKSVVIQRI